jgi:hypothetical protein
MRFALMAFLVLVGVVPRAEAQTEAASQARASGVPKLAGTWTRGGPTTEPELVLTRRAIGLRDAIDEPLAGMYDCVPATVPHILGDPYNFTFEQKADRVIQIFEKDAVTRTIWLEGHGHREATPSDFSLQGYSTGKYEGGQLVVRTTHFTFDTGGLEDKPPMVPSSTRKTVTERYSLKGDHLIVEALIEDPMFLEQPGRFTFEFQPTTEALVEWPECDREQASEVLNYIPDNQKKYGR